MKESRIANEIDKEYRERKAFENKKRQNCKEKQCSECQYEEVCVDEKEEKNV